MSENAEVAPATTEDEQVAELETLRAQVAAAKAVRNTAADPSAAGVISPARQEELDGERARLQAEFDETLETTSKETGASVEDLKAFMVSQVEAQQAAAAAVAAELETAEPVAPAAPEVSVPDVAPNSVPPPPGDQTPPDPSVPEVPDPNLTPPSEVVPPDPEADQPKTSRRGGNS